MPRFEPLVVPLLAGLLCLAAPALAELPPIHVVIFTHVEDNTPAGMLGSVQSRRNYLVHRSNLIAMAGLAESSGVPWTLQPDWKLLEHVNDPVVSGVWRPRDRDHYFEHDPGANIVAIGQWKRSVASISELIALRRSGAVPPDAMLTFSCNINPSTLGAPGGLAAVADTVFAPLLAWQDSGLVALTDFTSLVATRESAFGGEGYLYDAEAPVVSVGALVPPGSAFHLSPAAPNPVRTETLLRFSLAAEADVRLEIFDLLGRRTALLAEGSRPTGVHAARWDARRVPGGVYVCRLRAVDSRGSGRETCVARRLLVVH